MNHELTQPALAETQEFNAVKVGAAVFMALAVFTAIEYIIAINLEQNLVPLIAIAVVKAGLIVWYFMHLGRSWRGGHE